jgi:hypothetical protein
VPCKQTSAEGRASAAYIVGAKPSYLVNRILLQLTPRWRCGIARCLPSKTVSGNNFALQVATKLERIQNEHRRHLYYVQVTLALIESSDWRLELAGSRNSRAVRGKRNEESGWMEWH